MEKQSNVLTQFSSEVRYLRHDIRRCDNTTELTEEGCKKFEIGTRILSRSFLAGDEARVKDTDVINQQ